MIKIKVCHGHSCSQLFSKYTFDRAKEELEIKNNERGLSKYEKIELEKCPCQGNCKNAITVVEEKDKKRKLHSQMNPIKITKMIKKM